jgi:CRISPR/Cas system-associated protein Cas10 (large subunit of type III CRISPR-Cas system)
MVDKALLAGNLDEVQELSRKLTSAMQILADLAHKNNGWQVVFSGGDDIFLVISQSMYQESFIRYLMDQFRELTGGTMSFGVGATIEAAYVNLRRAKSNGTGTLVATDTSRANNSLNPTGVPLRSTPSG